MDKPPTLEQLEEELSAKKDYYVLEELIEDAEERYKILLRYKAVQEIRNTPDENRKGLIQLWADKLEKSVWTIQRMLKKFELEGLAALARTRRTDAGKLIGFNGWKKNSNEEWESREEAVEYWKTFIQEKYRKGNTASRRMSPNQIFNRVQDHAELELGLKQGEYPSCVFVYKVLEPIILEKKPKVRRPNQGPGIVVECYSKYTKKDKVKEEIVVRHSNQVWQIDHTRLDNLLIDANGERVGSTYITSVVDTYSGCVMGYHMGFDAAGSHEVALALRHAILLKHYGNEYKLEKDWEVCGIPEYIVTDNAEEFHSRHLKRIATQLGIKLRYRAYTEQGGIIERLFLNLKTEFAALLPGYKGGSLEERPHDAEKYTCIAFEEYDRLLVRYFVDHHNQHLYPRRKDQTRQTIWLNSLNGEPKVPDERELDICLLKETEPRKVQAYGTINCFATVYEAGWRKDEEGLMRYDKLTNFLLPYHGRHVVLRYNPSNIIHVLVYTLEENGQPSKHLGTVRARDLEEERLSLKEWTERKEKIREDGKKIDQSSILRQQRDLVKFSDDKVAQKKKEMRTRGRRRKEQSRITRNSPQSKVVQFPTSKFSPTAEVENEVIQAEANRVSLENRQEETRIASKPPLFVIENLDDFMEEDW